MLITVFTPTYNRAYKLRDLFDSLMQQTVKNFEWLIIDDGSSDNTKEIVDSFNTENKFNIRYMYKNNEGKQIAMNEAADLAMGNWIFIVDSDDILKPYAVEKVIHYCMQIQNDEQFAGVAGLRGRKNGEVWSTSDISKVRKTNNLIHNSEYIDATAIEYRYKHKIQGDRAEVIRTSLLKKYQFPKIVGENFIPEGYLWLKLASDGYKFRWFNQVIYITEYLNDGLTQNGRTLAKKNCKSHSMMDNLITSIREIPIKDRLISAVNYYRYGLYSGARLKILFKESKARYLSIVAIPAAFLFKIK